MKQFRDFRTFFDGIRLFGARIRIPREILYRIALVSAFFDPCEAISDHFSVSGRGGHDGPKALRLFVPCSAVHSDEISIFFIEMKSLFTGGGQGAKITPLATGPESVGPQKTL